MNRMDKEKMLMRKDRVSQIPSGWDITTVSMVCSIRNNLRLPISVKERQHIQGDYPYYGPTGILDYIDEYRLDGKFALIGEDGDHFLKYTTKLQTLLVDGKFNVNNHAHVIESTSDCNAEWFFNYFKHRNIINLLSRQGAGRYKLNKETLRKLPILVPPVKEQNSISEVLEIWGVAIEKKERLIESKEKKFKWLVSQLINKRSKTNGWKKVKVGELCQVTKGKQLNVAHMKADGEYYALNGGTEPSGRTDDWNTEANTITISEGGNSCGFVNFNRERFWSGGHCYSLINLPKTVSREYLFFFLKLAEPKLMKLRVGSGLPNIQKKDVDKFAVDLPSPQEQKEITETLNIAHQEIDLLKESAKKYKEQKWWLMQKLLTGQWRVKNG